MQIKQSFDWLFDNYSDRFPVNEIWAILIIKEAKMSLKLCHFKSDRNKR